MTVVETVSNQQLFTLEEAAKVLEQQKKVIAKQENEKRLEAQRLKAEQRATMCALFAERVKELRELHHKIIENKPDWIDFYERIKDEDPEAPSDWEESDDEWASSSC